MRHAASAIALFLALLTAVKAADVREREPDPSKASGKVYEWKSSDGLAYHYFIPRNYDAGKGANLTFILHGSNLTRSWGFANHKAGDFRPDDIVVSPDGTTPNGQGGFNSMGKPEDVEKFHTLHEELKSLFKINATYLYGHSQGSFFALHYAGEHPDSVQGIVAHASGLWTWSKRPAEAKNQAIVLMHGTADPVVSFGQSGGGLTAYREAGYSHVRLRALEGWGHWPAEHNGPIPHTSQQLAWVEGMTSNDMTRVGASFALLSRPGDKTLHDFGGLYLLAQRLTTMPDAPDRAKDAATSVMQKVDELAKQHIAEMRPPSPPAQADLSDAPWIGHLPIFLRQYEGVPAADEFRKAWDPILEKQRESVIAHFTQYREAVKAGNEAEAFAAGIAAIRDGYLMRGCTDQSFLNKLTAWADDRNLGIEKDAAKEGGAAIKSYREALEDGLDGFKAANKQAKF